MAWDMLAAERPSVQIQRLYFLRFDLHDTAWCAEFEDGEWSEVDSLTIRSLLQSNLDLILESEK